MADTHLPARPPRAAPQSVTPLASMVASAKRISSREMKRTWASRWQDEAWAMHDEVGELRFVANSLAAAASRARLFGAMVMPGDAEPSPIDPDDEDDRPDADALEASRIVSALGRNALGRSELIRRAFLNLFMPGDCYLVGLPPGVLHDEGPSELPPELALPVTGGPSLEDLTWQVMSVSEVQLRQDRVVLNVGDGSPIELPEDECLVIRVWRSHPRQWWQADSPVRSNLPVLRELVGLTKHVSATIDSRLAGAGLLVLPQSVEVAGAPLDPETAAEQPVSDFVDALLEAMVQPLENRDSAAAIVPLTIKVPDEVVDKVQHIRFDTPFDESAKDLRDEAIRRLALGLDAPAEVLLGLGGTNHWSAWQIDEATTKTHIEPGLALLCDALTTQYLWPALKEAGVDNPERFVVWFDTVELTMRPNRSGEALSLHERGALSDDALRRETGFGEEDAPDQANSAAVEAVLTIARNAPQVVAENPAIVSVLLGVFEQLLSGTLDPAEVEVPAAPADPSGNGLPDTRGVVPEGAPGA